MELVRLGRTNMMVPRLGFGGIPIQRLSEEDALAVVKRCLELGVTFLDTANGYTTSEERIGKAIAGRRDKDLPWRPSRGPRSEDLESTEIEPGTARSRLHRPLPVSRSQ